MRKLDRYILSELWIPFLIGLITVVFIFQANLLMDEIPQFQRAGAPLSVIFEYSLLKMPGFLKITLPVAMAVAASMAISRMMRESEITPIRVAGVSLTRIIFPILAFGTVLAFINFYIADKVMPSYEQKAHSLRSRYITESGSMDTRTNAILQIKNSTAAFGVMHKKGSNQLDISDALLVDRSKPNQTSFITASKAHYREGRWIFEKPYYRLVKNNELVTAVEQPTLHIPEVVDIDALFDPPTETEQTTKELVRAIEQGKHQKRDVTMLQVAYYDKFSTPAACIIFALTAPILAVWLARAGAFAGVLLSILVVLAYLNIQVISTEIFGRNGWFSPIVASWFPNILFALVGIFAIRRTE